MHMQYKFVQPVSSSPSLVLSCTLASAVTPVHMHAVTFAVCLSFHSSLHQVTPHTMQIQLVSSSPSLLHPGLCSHPSAHVCSHRCGLSLFFTLYCTTCSHMHIYIQCKGGLCLPLHSWSYPAPWPLQSPLYTCTQSTLWSVSLFTLYSVSSFPAHWLLAFSDTVM